MKPSILIVEDDPDITKILKHRLTKEGFEVFIADDGEQGLQIAISEIPSLILLDVMLPEKGGFEVLTELKAQEKTSKIPVILLTSKIQEEDVLRGLETGASDYLKKPFSIPELLLRIKKYLRAPNK